MNPIPETTVELDGLQLVVRSGAVALAAILGRKDALLLAARLCEVAAGRRPNEFASKPSGLRAGKNQS